MKDSGGERMHYPYGECILSPTDFDVGSEKLANNEHGHARLDQFDGDLFALELRMEKGTTTSECAAFCQLMNYVQTK